jgi:succinate-acetate transporter protein
MAELNSAVGLYHIAWSCTTFLFLIAALKTSIAVFGLFFFLDVSLWLASTGFLAPSPLATQIGGFFGIIASIFAAYLSLAGILAEGTSYFKLPIGDFSDAR